MLQECMEVFRENFKQYSEQWVLDNYVPKDGTYFLLILMTIFLWETLLKLKPIEKQGKYRDRKPRNIS